MRSNVLKGDTAFTVMLVKVQSCLVVWDGKAKRREFSLLAVACTLALPLAVQTHILVLALVITGCLLVLTTPSAPAYRTQVLCGLLIVLEHRALLVPPHTGTVHLVFTGNIKETEEKQKRKLNVKFKAEMTLLCYVFRHVTLIPYNSPAAIVEIKANGDLCALDDRPQWVDV